MFMALMVVSFTYVCECSAAQSCPTCCDLMDYSTRLLCPWNFPGKNNGVGCHFLLQGIFLTQGSNLCLLLWQTGSLQLCHWERNCQAAFNTAVIILFSLYSTSLSAFSGVSVPDFSRSNRCVVVSHCYFSLRFPDDMM